MSCDGSTKYLRFSAAVSRASKLSGVSSNNIRAKGAERRVSVTARTHSAYSAQTGHSVHRKLISDPTANWTAIPAQSDHFGAKRRGVNSLLR